MIAATRKEDPDRRNRVLLLIAVTLLLISAGMFGTLYYLQHRLETAHKPTRARGTIYVRISDRERKAILDKADRMRAKWRAWALAHKGILRQMLRAFPDDQKAFQRVYSAIPSFDVHAGFAPMEVGGTEPGFTWDLTVKKVRQDAGRAASEVDKKREAKSLDIAAKETAREFQELRDIQLAESTNGGPVHYVLWASGRVTETKTLGNNKPLGDRQQTHKELQPPYEFLR